MNVLDDYVQEEQKQDLWCWAAVACSVAGYPNGTTWTQCGIAQRVLARQTCCASPSSCNVMDSLRDALAVTDCLGEHQQGPVDLETIRRQIDVRRPVGIRVHRADGSAHVMAIVGYDDGRDDQCMLEIRDPWLARSDTVAYGVLRHGTYRGGHWSDTYFTI
jgi:hypothetical protein